MCKGAIIDPFNLQRFIDAQAPYYERVLAELRGGRKATHWIWYIFPQIDGLAHSATSRFFAICSLKEAQAYLAHPVLGPRLRKCTVLAIDAGKSAGALFGQPDDLKFRSSMTLFKLARSGDPLFAEALERLCGGEADDRTVAIVEALARSGHGI